MTQAIPSKRFADSIGICSHLNFRGTVWGSDGWIPLFRATGVRHTRTQIGRGANARAAAAQLLAMEATASVTVDPTSSPGVWDAMQMGEQVDFLATIPDLVANIAGPNEPNNPAIKTTGWQNRLMGFQESLYRRVKGTPALASKPVLWTPPWAKRMVDFDKMIPRLSQASDAKNGHYYCGARRPTIAGFPSGTNENGEGDAYSLDQFLSDHHRQRQTGDFYVTECGYDHSGPGNPLSGWVAPPEVVAKYLPRMSAEMFRRGVKRAYIYSLIDDARTPPHYHGLLDQSLNPRPAYFALCNLMALHDDALAADHATGEIEYLLNDDAGISSLPVMQKADGTFLFTLWRDVDSFDRVALVETAPAPLIRRLDFGGRMNSIRIHYPTLSADPVQECRGASNVEVAVQDQLTVVAVNP